MLMPDLSAFVRKTHRASVQDRYAPTDDKETGCGILTRCP